MLVSDVSTPEATERRATETEAALPHQLGCFEWYAEEMVERAAEQGVQLDGDLDEVYQGMTIIAHFHQDMVEGTRECHCDIPYDGDEEY